MSPILTWNASLATGIGQIDEQHQHLFGLVNQLSEAAQQGQERNVLSGCITGVSEYTDYHFATEEGYMREHDYPDSEAHKAEHREFVRKSIDFLIAYVAGDEDALTIEVLDYLTNWLQTHIPVADKHLGDYLAARDVA